MSTYINPIRKLPRTEMLKERRKQQRDAIATYTPSKYKDRSKYKGNGELK